MVAHKIRLNGIDAPELGMELGKKSKENLSYLVFDKQVSVVSHKTDRYGRMVGYVFVGTQDIGLEQVRNGFAWHYKKYEIEQAVAERLAYQSAEILARESRLGLWTLFNAIPPWDYRNGKKTVSKK